MMRGPLPLALTIVALLLGGLCEGAAAEPARLVVNYTEQRDSRQSDREPVSADLPKELTQLVKDVMALADLEAVANATAPVTVRIDGEASVYSARYRSDVTATNARATFRGLLHVTRGDTTLFRVGLGGVIEQPTYVGLPPGEKTTDVGVEARDATLNSDLPFHMLRFVRQTRGIAAVVAGLEAENPHLVQAASEYLEGALSDPTSRGETIALLRGLLNTERTRSWYLAVHLLEPEWLPGSDASERERLMFYLYSDWVRGEPVYSAADFAGSSITVLSATLAEVWENPLHVPGLYDEPATNRFGMPLPGRMGAPDRFERAANLLARLGKDGIDVLLRQLQQSGEQNSRLGWALARTGESGRDALLSLNRNLDVSRNADKEVRKSCLWVLSLLGQFPEQGDLTGVDPALLKTYRDISRRTPLLELLQSDVAPDDVSRRYMRRNALYHLKGVQDERMLEALSQVVEEGDYGLREAAVEALGILGDRRALPLLEKVQRDHARAVLDARARLLAFGY